jgi:8-oxo-dGTP pyrophosphatase MutT (NUDIX family)
MPISPEWIRQAAAVPVRAGQVCLVSSRSGKRWVIPKGNLEPGKTAGEIALQEAWEEAGLAGILRPEPVGSYLYDKAGLTCYVAVYLLTVTQSVDEYPEREMRERSWVSFAQALLRVEEVGLREILRSVALVKEAC